MEKRLEENNVKNENDRKKTYLRAYRKHGKRIKRIESEIEEIRNMKMYPSSNNDGMPHGSNQSDLSSYAAALQEREDELYQEGVKQVQTYKDIEYRINKLENQDERDVMFYKYIKGFTWWQIAQLMEYSDSKKIPKKEEACERRRVPDPAILRGQATCKLGKRR